MERYQALYLKYRPTRFEDVVGQEHVTRTLQNALRTDKVSHAYLFAGPRGTGKTTMARILARALNCERGPTAEPCGECGPCREMALGSSMDVLEMDAASQRSIDDIRDLREKVKFSPARSRARVYIIDEAHQITREGANAFLKTLEEPPAHAYFVLVTTEPERLLATIQSRCQRFDLRLIPAELLAQHVRVIARKEGIRLSEGAVMMIASAAEGAARDALALLEQVSHLSKEEVTAQDIVAMLGLSAEQELGALVEAVVKEHIAEALALLDQMLCAGRDPHFLLRDLTQYLRDGIAVRVGAPGTRYLLEVKTGGPLAALPLERGLEMVEIAATTSERESHPLFAGQRRLLIESALVRLCQAATRRAAVEAPRATSARTETPAKVAPQPAAVAEKPTPAGPPPKREVAPEAPAEGPAVEPPTPAPKPQPAPTAAPQAAATEVVSEEQRLWEKIVARMNEEQRLPMASLVEHTRVRLENGTLVVLFDFEFNMQEFQAQLLNTAEAAWLAKAIEEAFGRALEVRPKMEEANQAAPAKAGQEPSEHEVFTKVRTIFPDAEPLTNEAGSPSGRGSSGKAATRGARGGARGARGKRAGG